MLCLHTCIIAQPLQVSDYNSSYFSTTTVEPRYIEHAYFEIPVRSKSVFSPGQMPLWVIGFSDGYFEPGYFEVSCISSIYAGPAVWIRASISNYRLVADDINESAATASTAVVEPAREKPAARNIWDTLRATGLHIPDDLCFKDFCSADSKVTVSGTLTYRQSVRASGNDAGAGPSADI